ncbi:MAG: type II secretion system protein [Leuconostoc citreum]
MLLNFVLFQQKNGEIILVGDRKGFTLIESLVSFGIIALLLLTMQLVLPMFKWCCQCLSIEVSCLQI